MKTRHWIVAAYSLGIAAALGVNVGEKAKAGGIPEAEGALTYRGMLLNIGLPSVDVGVVQFALFDSVHGGNQICKKSVEPPDPTRVPLPATTTTLGGAQ